MGAWIIGGGQRETPPEIKGPGRNRGSGAALSPMATVHSRSCPAQSGLPGKETLCQALSPGPVGFLGPTSESGRLSGWPK